MKFIYFFSMLTISISSFANDFGDLMPLPELGNKWEVLIIGSKNTTRLEVVNITKDSVTERMTTETYDIFSTTNYSVKNNVCYIEPIVQYDAIAKHIYNQKRVFSPASKCIIKAHEMPYHEIFTTLITDLNSGQTSQEKRDRTYNFRGIESIITPAGKYLAEKIEIKGSKMSRFQWRDKNNSLIKHQVKFYNTGKETTSILQKGRGQ